MTSNPVSTSIPVSASLLRSCAGSYQWEPSRLAKEFETDTTMTRKASLGPRPVMHTMSDRFKTKFNRQWQRSPDRAASMRRKRQLGGSGGLPHTVRHVYTVGEAAVMFVIGDEYRKRGVCDLPIDALAARAGVSRTTVQNAIRTARAHFHVDVQRRPRKGQKNLTNLIRIVSKDWLAWLERGCIGFKHFHPTESHRNKPERESAAPFRKRAYVRENTASAEGGSEACMSKRVRAAPRGSAESHSDDAGLRESADGPPLDLHAVA